jgi:GNAT superfamily N-acetyltransferase/adenylate kinase family enzyme
LANTPGDNIADMERVLVLGRGGAGKSTFARELGLNTGLPVVELDKRFWQDGLVPLSRELWATLQRELVEPAAWILDGDLGPYDVLDPRLAAADTVIVLDYSLVRCAWQSVRRSRERLDYWVWVLRYRRRSLPALLADIARYAASADVYMFQNPRSAARFLRRRASAGPDRGLVIRRYEPSDATIVWKLHDDGLRQTNSHAGDGPWDDDLRNIRKSYLDGGGEFLVAVLDGEVVAMGALRRISDTIGEIKRMRVAAPLQGQGIGRVILDRLIQRARELGYGTLRLDTTSAQIPAQRLYRSRGFREISRTGHSLNPEIIVLERVLNAAD